MLWVWVLDAVDMIVSWVTSWFPDVTIPFPAPFALVVPVPLGITGSIFDAWVTWSVLIAGALIVGRILTWLYRLIPANG